MGLNQAIALEFTNRELSRFECFCFRTHNSASKQTQIIASYSKRDIRINRISVTEI